MLFVVIDMSGLVYFSCCYCLVGAMLAEAPDDGKLLKLCLRTDTHRRLQQRGVTHSTANPLAARRAQI